MSARSDNYALARIADMVGQSDGDYSTDRLPERLGNLLASFVEALDLHKARIRLLQEALCECQATNFFQADLHDETCPVYVLAAEQPKASA